MEQGKGSGSGTPVYVDSGDENPDSYNKMRYHASKMDLNLRILRDQMVSIVDDKRRVFFSFVLLFFSFKV